MNHSNSSSSLQFSVVFGVNHEGEMDLILIRMQVGCPKPLFKLQVDIFYCVTVLGVKQEIIYRISGGVMPN